MNFKLEECKSKKSCIAKPIKPIKLNLNKLPDKFKILTKTPIVVIAEIKGYQVIIHKHGEIRFKTNKIEKEMEQIVQEIYKKTIK